MTARDGYCSQNLIYLTTTNYGLMRLRLQEELSQPKNIRSEKYDLPISSDENEPFMVGLERTIIATILPTRPNTDIIVRNRPMMKLNIVYLSFLSCSCRQQSSIFTTSKPGISTFFPLYTQYGPIKDHVRQSNLSIFKK